MSNREIKCDDCGWRGHEGELFCSEEDGNSKKFAREITFNRCPKCDSLDISDIAEEGKDER